MASWPGILAASVFVLVSASGAEAASFDCSKAEAADEIAICANPQLSALDSEMGGLWFAYSKVPMLMGGNGARHDEADAFLKSRAQCGGKVSCLKPLYQARIKSLRSSLTTSLDRFKSCL